MRPMLTGLLVLFALATPCAAEWRFEPSRRSLATTIVRDLGPDSFYGFTCFRRRWSFCFNHSPANGGLCEDHQACEGAVRSITNTIVIAGRGEHQARFELTENTYYGAEDISPDGLAAMAEAGAIRLKLDPRLAEIWGVDALDLPMDGLRQAIESRQRRLDCPVGGATPTR